MRTLRGCVVSRVVHVSVPELDPALERVRGIMGMKSSTLTSLHRTSVSTLLDAMGIDARVLVRRKPVWEPARFSGRGWTDYDVMLAECAAQVASEATVRLFNLLANRLGAAGELPTGYNRRASR